MGVDGDAEGMARVIGGPAWPASVDPFRGMNNTPFGEGVPLGVPHPEDFTRTPITIARRPQI
jgi:hypothetical protein